MERALDELRRGAGIQFDPDLVAVFLGLLQQELAVPVPATRPAESEPDEGLARESGKSGGEPGPQSAAHATAPAALVRPVGA